MVQILGNYCLETAPVGIGYCVCALIVSRASKTQEQCDAGLEMHLEEADFVLACAALQLVLTADGTLAVLWD